MLTTFSRSHRAACFIVLVVLVRSSANGANALNSADYSGLKKRIQQGQAQEVLKLAHDAVGRDPDNWFANNLQSDALLALGRDDEAEAGLTPMTVTR